MITLTAPRKLLAILTTSACLSALALTGAATATPALAAGSVHGCPSGDTCLYNSQAAYNASRPTEVVFVLEGALDVGFITTANVLVNNSDPAWSSEGNFVLVIPGVLCVYQADSHDVQAPDTTEDPADGAQVDGFAFGATQASVSGTIIAALNDCHQG